MTYYQKVYRTGETTLFLVMEDVPEPLTLVNVSNIQFSPKHLLHVQASLPEHRKLLEIQDGAEFIITYSECGPRCVFDNGFPLFHFKNCKVKSKYVHNSVSMHEDHLIFVDVLFECEIEIPEWG